MVWGMHASVNIWRRICNIPGLSFSLCLQTSAINTNGYSIHRYQVGSSVDCLLSEKEKRNKLFYNNKNTKNIYCKISLCFMWHLQLHLTQWSCWFKILPVQLIRVETPVSHLLATTFLERLLQNVRFTLPDIGMNKKRNIVLDGKAVSLEQ